MKRFRFIRLSLVVAVLFSTNAIAQQNSREVIYIKSARFAAPLIEKWASEYEKVNSQIEIKFAEGQSSAEDIDLSFITSINEEGAENGNQIVSYTGRYALLPVTNAENPLLNELSRKRLNGKRLESLFFDNDILDEYSDSSDKQKYDITIYSGTNSNSFAGIFASHFGYSAADIRGRKISGDDIFLINAIQKDNSGVTFNNLSYIFDIDTRGLKNGLALIPLDIKKEQREILQEADIDKTIALLENERISLIPVENIGFVYQENNIPAKRFLKWILSEGQKYNQEYGFLKVEEATLSAQLKKIEDLLLTASF
ncbi:ABC-type phosphate transport system, substrate-binding protein [Porphyromonadaceae bacterium NLAE-zl-C104]|nr:ABC-type phosphate transport system, substrate-binding protein [Porphyromonadaceae bacterium NLAE-zl-C104]